MRKTKKYSSVFAIIALAFVGTLWVSQTVLAAAGSLYLTPTTQSITKDGTFKVNLKINPGMSIDTVSATVSFDAAKVNLTNVECATTFTAFPSCPSTSNPLSITAAKLGGSVNTDTLIATLTFQARVGTGSTTISLSGNDATAGTQNNPSVTSATVSFTTPACPSGQTGTYPNCTTPPSSGTGSSGTSGSTSGTSGSNTANPKPSGTSSTPKPTTTTTPKPSGTSSSGSSAASPSPTAPANPESTTAPANAPAVTVTPKDVNYSLATLGVSSTAPTQVSIRYSSDQQHYTDTPYSELATNHDVALDPSLLQPGQTYYYVVLVKDQQGNVTQTDVKTIRTKGLSIKVGVFDKNHQPLRNKTVTLHSKPYTVKTDGGGFATFTDIAAGTHHVSYTTGKKDYVQEINVANTVKTTGKTQTAALQNVAVVLPVEQKSSVFTTTSSVLLLVLLAVAGYVIFRQRRLLKPLLIPDAASAEDEALIVQAPVSPSVQSSLAASEPTVPASNVGVKSESLESKLAAIPHHYGPAPGTTIAPTVQNNETSQDTK